MRSRRTASCRRSTPRSTGTSSSAPSCGWRRGPAPARRCMFNNIKDYNKPDSRCRRIFGSALNSYRRIAMMLGLPPDTHPRELVKIGRTILTGSIPPKIVATGPVKENILTGADIDLYELPVAALEPARRRPLSPHLWRLRHQGSRDRHHECRHLSRHGGRPRPHPDPDVARPAYRPPLHRLAERRRGRDADRGRHRLGAVARLHAAARRCRRACANTT